MKVVVKSELCEGYGNCARLAPEVFTLDDEGFSKPLNDGQVPEDQRARAEFAVGDCPMGAITSED